LYKAGCIAMSSLVHVEPAIVYEIVLSCTIGWKHLRIIPRIETNPLRVVDLVVFESNSWE
jgi:hypothetical protein